jgi:hypothetical protein
MHGRVWCAAVVEIGKPAFAGTKARIEEVLCVGREATPMNAGLEGCDESGSREGDAYVVRDLRDAAWEDSLP